MIAYVTAEVQALSCTEGVGTEESLKIRKKSKNFGSSAGKAEGREASEQRKVKGSEEKSKMPVSHLEVENFKSYAGVQRIGKSWDVEGGMWREKEGGKSVGVERRSAEGGEEG